MPCGGGAEITLDTVVSGVRRSPPAVPVYSQYQNLPLLDKVDRLAIVVPLSIAPVCETKPGARIFVPLGITLPKRAWAIGKKTGQFATHMRMFFCPFSHSTHLGILLT